MTELVYQKDSYVKEIEAKVVNIDGNRLILDRTIFHPYSGGISNDTGEIVANNIKYRVVSVKFDEKRDVIHILDKEFKGNIGETVRLILDWNRRYRLMRLHTAAHIISAIMYKDYNALITGGHIDPDRAKDDFSIKKMDRKIFEDTIIKANQIIKKNIEVNIRFLPREEAFKIPGIIKLASKMPPNIKILRIVEIPGIDIQADGGPHVKNTGEIGEIVLLKVENKGKNKKRIYYTVKP